MGKSNVLSQRLNHGIDSNNNQDMVLINPEFLTIYIIKYIAVKGEKKILLIDICHMLGQLEQMYKVVLSRRT